MTRDGQIRVLYIEDDEDDFILASEYLEEAGTDDYVFDWAPSYAEGWERMAKRSHDIYLVDYRLGELSGLDMITQAREAGIHSPMILLTGRGDREIDIAAMAAGASDYLAKDEINSKILERAIRYTLNQHEMAERLRDSEARLRDYVETASDWIWECDAEMRITAMSGPGLTGYPAEIAKKMIGKRSWEVEEVKIAPADNARQIAKMEAHEAFTGFEYGLYDPASKGTSHIRISGKPVYSSSGKFLGFRGTGSDVTQQRETERRLRQSQKMEAVGQLTGGLAHDFNNILQVAGVTLDWLGQAIQGDERLEQRVETALLAVERGSTLTRQLLTFAREQQLESEIAAPNKLVEDARALLKQTLPEDIELTIELAPEAPAIKVDVGMFDNALINLALNARDAMPDGGALTISTRRKTYQGETADSDGEAIYGAYVVVSLRDTGSGIDENNLKKVLEPFYTTKGVGRGTGLGLSMVYGFVHQCGGYLLIASELGKGTEISLLFPAIAGNAAACGPAAVDARRAVAEGEGTVLLVEDDELVRMSVNEMLTELGYTVIEAVNGQAALDQLEAAQRSEHPIDVILSDIVMPGDISGLDLVDIIKAEYPDMKLVLTSGYSNRFGEFGNNGNGDNSGGVGSGGPKDIAFLRKPFKVKDLAETLRKTLDPSPPPVKPNLERSLEEELFAL